MEEKIGKQSLSLKNPALILSAAAVVGPKEGAGPLGYGFDTVWEDELCGADSWEKAESLLQKQALELALKKRKLQTTDLRYLLAGDLINQITPSHFAARDTQIPFLGLYGACSTMGLGLSLGSMLIDAGFADCLAVEASSHYCTSEKQFRTPLGYGSQRPLYATWTVTGCGAVILGQAAGRAQEGDVVITRLTNGFIVDYGIKDAFNMGAAMAPAAAALIQAHFEDFGVDENEYDAIYTGDLGYYGSELLYELLEEKKISIRAKHRDCGCLIYDREEQDTHGGGSGCGCSAVTLTGHLLRELRQGQLRRILFIPTGALLSPLSAQQGESIPCIAHGVVLERIGEAVKWNM